MNNWTVIFRDTVPGVAGVSVYDKGAQDILGRFTIGKTMKTTRGTRHTQAYTKQRVAAIRRAQKFLNQRAEMAGVKYSPGDGNDTLAFRSVNAEGIA